MSDLPKELRKAAENLYEKWECDEGDKPLMDALAAVLEREADIQTTLQMLDEVGMTDGALTLSAAHEMQVLARVINEG